MIFRTVGWTLQLQILRLVTASCGTNCSGPTAASNVHVQPHLDVNQVEQSIGRSHRSVGKLIQHFTHLIDHEQGRPQAVCHTLGCPSLVVSRTYLPKNKAILMKKMSHLKANTTGKPLIQLWANGNAHFINYCNEVAATQWSNIPNSTQI